MLDVTFTSTRKTMSNTDVHTQVLRVKKTIEDEISRKLPMVIDNGYGSINVEVIVYQGVITHVSVTEKETKKIAWSG